MYFKKNYELLYSKRFLKRISNFDNLTLFYTMTSPIGIIINQNIMKKMYAILILALISFWNAIYLTLSALNYKAWDRSSLFCDVSQTLSCSNLFGYDFAWIFGIPFPAIAMVVYPIIALIAWVAIFKKKVSFYKILAILAVMWALFNAYIIFNEYQVWVYCLACLACTCAIVTIWILSILGTKQKSS